MCSQPRPPKEDKGPPPPFEPWLAIRKGECRPIKVRFLEKPLLRVQQLYAHAQCLRISA